MIFNILNINRAGIFIIAGVIVGIILLELIVPQTSKAEPVLDETLILSKPSYEVAKKIKMVVTAYSSTIKETDDTPLITASGKTVIDGIIANNMLPFGSKIRIPELYGDKIFVVEDRMHRRKGKYHIDIWFPEYSEAKNFGAKLAYIEILKN
ncbi:MAG: hypothetical protein CEN87_107 [Parcubacteria group bacterium Licking1014_1]|nr:MAG: hypothetical protein CEN87_107 [Parcubacteria group bacterium Licking1014_1]